MKLFCIHKWVVFRTAKRKYNSLADEWTHTHDGVVIYHGFRHTGLITDNVCSKCHKLDLNIQKLVEKAKTVEDRNVKAREWALKYIDLADKA